ncbi:MAG: tetratricopeptide repeat protein [Bacteriovoracaceae bacterium]
MNKELSSPLILKYQKELEKNPKSRAFAPLAEAYRKYGFIEKSISLLLEGIKEHPNYMGAHVTLAKCYFDQNKFNRAYQLLKNYVANGTENIALIKTYAASCIELGYQKEGLKYYKYLLFLNPNDEEALEKIKKVEEESEVDSIISFEKEEADAEQDVSKALLEEASKDVYKDADNWLKVDIEKPDDSASLAGDQIIEVRPKGIDASELEFIPSELVDLYQEKGMHHKALELAEECFRRDPENKELEAKITEIKRVVSPGLKDVSRPDQSLLIVDELNKLKASFKSHFTKNF